MLRVIPFFLLYYLLNANFNQVIKLKNKIGVIIVTSLNRNDVLFSRSLKSVLTQKLLPDYILIVDDNEEYKVSHEIECKLDEIKIKYKFPQIYYVKNIHTKGMSGTGGWNTGFEWYEKKFTYRDYIAILDDDDRWQEDYLKKCYEKIIECEPDQIIAFLKRTDLSLPCRFNIEDLCIKNFLKGNPGVQGSNMFFKFGAIKLIGGFDESLASCTDRDFMIKVLTKMPNLIVKIIDEVLVEHFAEKSSITYDLIKKENGLDVFYKKHISLFTRNILENSLRRSKKLFEYKNCTNIRKWWELKHKKNEEAKIVIGVALHNNQATIRNAITSILTQIGVKRNVWILIVDDNSSDNWMEKISDLLDNNRILYWKVKYRNVSKVRNFINSFIKEYFGNVLLIGRLDSDDIYSENTVLSKIEQLKEETNADYIIAGNYVQLNGKRQENRASSKLLNNLYLLDLLKNMSLGRAKNELPSCNIFMTPQKICEYPEKESAEDHFLVAKVLLNREKNKVVIAENLFLTVYNLNGCVTNSNKKKEIYYYAREELYMDVLEDIKNEYKNKVMDILNNNIEGNLKYIGHGKEGFVFHDNKWVYKVLDFSSSKTEKSCVMNRLCFFLRREKRKYKSFYEIEELIEVKEGVFIEKYLYEESEEVMQFTEKDIVQLLVECWQKKVIILDCKKENFIRVNGDLKLIDMDACTAYMDNLFINECARFIFIIRMFQI